MVMTSSCPVCDSDSRWEPFITFHDVPKTGVFPFSSSNPIGRQDLVFEYCPDCGLLRRHVPGIVSDPEYTDVNRSTAGQLPDYLAVLEEEVTSFFPDKTSLLVDVGGNDGTFVRRLCQNGYDNCLNVEPSLELARRSRESGCQTLCAPLTHEVAARIVTEYGKAKILFLRHVLEHVANPVAMLRSIHGLLDEDGIFYLEFPDCRDIIEDGMAHELWEEHLYYFSPSTATALLAKTGFVLSSQTILPHRAGHNILIRARKTRPSAKISSQSRVSKEISYFAQHWNNYCAKLHQAASFWPRPIYMMGASHPQTNFIHFCGIQSLISQAVDDDSIKVGRFLNMLPPVPIINTAKFKDTAIGGTLLLTAWGCDSWTSDLSAFALGKGMHVIAPYEIRSKA